MKTPLLAAAAAAALAVLLFLQPPVAISGAYVEVVPPDLAIVGSPSPTGASGRSA
jgi:hypothetical protein